MARAPAAPPLRAADALFGYPPVAFGMAVAPMPSWDNFFVAQLGASAALTGLLFVGISINMTKIIAFPSLLTRALKALSLLVLILVVASLMLVPGQPPLVGGVEMLVTALGGGALISGLSVRIRLTTDAQFRATSDVEIVTVVAIAALYIAAGYGLTESDPWGSFLLVPAIVVSFLVAILDSWILLVEVNR
jgi:hypothetical protein